MLASAPAQDWKSMVWMNASSTLARSTVTRMPNPRTNIQVGVFRPWAAQTRPRVPPARTVASRKPRAMNSWARRSASPFPGSMAG